MKRATDQSRVQRKIKCVLSIAGSDSSGGAGIQADIKTCAALGVYCATVITAVTAQNPAGVKAIKYVGDEMLMSQLEAVMESITPDAVKIGMLPCENAVRIVADSLSRHKLKNIILDPVLSATSGRSLAGEGKEKKYATIAVMKEVLFPLCTIVTPNLPELRILAQDTHMSLTDSQENERNTTQGKNTSPEINTSPTTSTLPAEWGCKAILIKGGHSHGETCTDILLTSTEEKHYIAKRVSSKHTHGTGCTLSSSLAAHLALGHEMPEAVSLSKEFTLQCIKRSCDSGLFTENGPLIHFQPH